METKLHLIDMNVAIALFRERVSPRLDIADTFVLYRIEAGDLHIVEKLHVINLLNDRPGQLLSLLQKKEVTTLICGGCPHFLLRMLSYQGIQVLPVAESMLSQVEKALRENKLSELEVSVTKPFCNYNNKNKQWCKANKRRR